MTTAAGSLVYRIWYAEQRGYLANLVPALASLASLCGVWWISGANLENRFGWMVIASFLPAALLPSLCLLWRIRQLSFLLRNASVNTGNILIKRAAKFWGYSLLSTAVIQVDYLIMSQLLPADQIVVYNVTTKFFTVAFMLYSAILIALWPVCAEAAAQRDWHTIRKFIARCLCIGGLGVIILTVLLAFFMPRVLALLAPQTNVSVPVPFILLTGLYLVLRVWCDTFSIVLQSMSFMRPFYLYLPLQAAASGLLQWFFTVRFGLNGIMFGLIASFALTAVWVLPWFLRRRMVDHA
jgi:O-antigen/teichoic acid export membrane protein